jgi:hypothetical protein
LCESRTFFPSGDQAAEKIISEIVPVLVKKQVDWFVEVSIMFTMSRRGPAMSNRLVTVAVITGVAAGGTVD